jgi:hypothetical protein
MTSKSPIVAVCFVSRNDSPLYFKAFSGGSEESVRMQLACYASLDMADERANGVQIAGASSSSSDAPTRDPFLGLLMPVDEQKVFGYLTSTGIRILIVVRDVLLREDRVRELFKGLHKLYADAISSPFAETDTRLSSPMFEEGVTRLCESADVLYRGPIPL